MVRRLAEDSPEEGGGGMADWDEHQGSRSDKMVGGGGVLGGLGILEEVRSLPFHLGSEIHTWQRRKRAG